MHFLSELVFLDEAPVRHRQRMTNHTVIHQDGEFTDERHALHADWNVEHLD